MPDGLRRAGVLRLHELPDEREKLLVVAVYIEKVIGAEGETALLVLRVGIQAEGRRK